MLKKYIDHRHLRRRAKLKSKVDFLNEYTSSHIYNEYENLKIETNNGNNELYYKILGRDFNDIKYHGEKLGGTRKLNKKAYGFNVLIDTLNLHEPFCAKGLFTWSNKRLGEE